MLGVRDAFDPGRTPGAGPHGLTMMRRPARELNPRQARFVHEYILGKSAAEAARLAGFSHKYKGGQLLQIPAIKAAIEEARAEIRESTTLTFEKLMAKLETALEGARAAKQFTAVAKILELQGKLAGLMIERIQVEVPSLVQARAEALARVSNLSSHRFLEAIDVPVTPAPTLPEPRTTSPAASPRADIFGD